MTFVTPKPDGIGDDEWAANVSEPAAYSGEAPDRSREHTEAGPNGEVLGRFREILLHTKDLNWVDKTWPACLTRCCGGTIPPVPPSRWFGSNRVRGFRPGIRTRRTSSCSACVVATRTCRRPV